MPLLGPRPAPDCGRAHGPGPAKERPAGPSRRIGSFLRSDARRFDARQQSIVCELEEGILMVTRIGAAASALIAIALSSCSITTSSNPEPFHPAAPYASNRT